MTIRHIISVSLAAVMSLAAAGSVHSQDQPPFTFTFHGGLFFPSKADFKQTFGTSSDLIWSGGVNLPVGGSLFLAGNIAYFRSKGFIDASADSSSRYVERFIHVGLLHKRMIASYLALRLMAGVNRVYVQQVLRGANEPERSLDTGNRFGFFGGAGVEQMLDDPHVSFFLDAIYDYSRAYEREFSGDFGGFRVVLGVNFILF